MGAPTCIAVNQTGSDVVLVQLACTVPAAGQVTLSDFNKASEIQDDDQLKNLIEDGTLLINDGSSTLTRPQSLCYVTTVAAPVNLTSSVPDVRVINTADGLQGGGDLSADRTIVPVYGNTIRTVTQGNDARLSDARNPTAHATSHLMSGVASDPLTSGMPVTIGTSNTQGAADTVSRSDHTHDHGAQPGGAQHAAATASNNGFMASADKQKLDGIASGVGTTVTVERDTTTTTTSASSVVVDGMSLSLPVGNWLVQFSGDLQHSAFNASIWTSIYSGGLQVSASQRLFRRGSSQGNTAGTFYCTALVKVSGTTTVGGYWRTSAATATNSFRQLCATRVG